MEDFAYDLLDQVKRIEEEGLLEEAGDRYASLFSEITAKAIAKGQKKVLYRLSTFYIVSRFL